MFGLVGFRRDEKDQGEKSGEKIIFLECLVGVILGEKIGGAKYFLSEPTKTFSPQFREKTQVICLVILVLFVPLIAMLKSLNRHLSFLFFFFLLFLVISFFVGLFISLNYFLVYFLVDLVSCLRIFPLVFLFLLCLFSINLSAIFFPLFYNNKM